MNEQMIEAAMKAMREEQRVNQNLELGFDDDVYDLAVLTIAAIEPFIEGALKDRIEALTAENERKDAALFWIADICAHELRLKYNDDMRKAFQRDVRDAARAALEKQP